MLKISSWFEQAGTETKLGPKKFKTLLKSLNNLFLLYDFLEYLTHVTMMGPWAKEYMLQLWNM